MKPLPSIFYYLSGSIGFLPLIVALINYKFVTSYYKPLFYFLIISVLTELLAHTLIFLNLGAQGTYYVYTLCEFVFISSFYRMFFKNHFRPLVIDSLLFLIIPMSILQAYFTSPINADNYLLTTESFLFTCYSLYFFFFILKNLIFENLLNAPVFWINAGVLFYFTGNLCIFIFSNYIALHITEKYSLLYNVIHTSFNVLMNIFFSIGFWKLRAK